MKNNLGVDPNEWFSETKITPDIKDPPVGYSSPDWEDTAPSEYEPPYENPLDSMPIARDNPRPEEDMADWFKVEKPDESDQIEEEKKTIHEKMYKIATAKYNPFSVGGSENCDSDISCNIGGSEEITK